MPDEKTHADSIRVYLSGAASDGAAQAEPDDALGAFRGSTRVDFLSASSTGNISNVTISHVSYLNGTGAGTLTAESTSSLSWTPPSGTKGATVTIANGETKVLEGGAGEINKFVVVSRTSASNLSGTDTVTLTNNYNCIFDDVTSAEALAGMTDYRAVFIKNDSASTVGDVKVRVATLGTQAVTDDTQLAASGAGTIVTTDSFSDWPARGYGRVMTSLGAIKEIIYYSSRTTTVLTVPATGRGLLGTNAQAGAATDTIDAVPGIRLAKEEPDAPTDGEIQTIADDTTAPVDFASDDPIEWKSDISYDGNIVDIGDLATGEIYGLWIEREIPEAAVADSAQSNAFEISFEAV